MERERGFIRRSRAGFWIAGVALLALTAAAAILSRGGPVPAPQSAVVTVFKSPSCGCCAAWVEHLEAAGFQVEVRNTQALAAVRERYGVPDALASCHTALVDGYVIEGHVPAADIQRLLRERPPGRGLAVPGMPLGSPGMEVGDRREPYEVLLFGDEEPRVYARHGR